MGIKLIGYFLASVLFQSVWAGQVPVTSKNMRYPYVREVSGKVLFSGVDEKVVPLLAKSSLVEKALIKTPAGAQVLIELDKTRSLKVLPNSEVFMPSIGWDSQQVPLIVLREGVIRWKDTEAGEGASYNVAVSSDLFQFILPKGEYELKMDSQKAQAEVRVFSGLVNFSAMNAEDSVDVQAGQQASFQGVLEDGKVSYDVLLKGKKIPRGQLSSAKAMDPKEFKAHQQEKERAKKLQEVKVREQQKAKEQLLSEGFICSAPAGKLNQCAWVCEGGPKKQKFCAVESGEAQCVRKRCNANGQWSDSTVLGTREGKIKCPTSFPTVGPCDY